MIWGSIDSSKTEYYSIKWQGVQTLYICVCVNKSSSLLSFCKGRSDQLAATSRMSVLRHYPEAHERRWGPERRWTGERKSFQMVFASSSSPLTTHSKPVVPQPGRRNLRVPTFITAALNWPSAWWVPPSPRPHKHSGTKPSPENTQH